MNNTLIIGATSAIAEALARRLAAAGDALFLVGRDMQKLEAVASDLRSRGAPRVECATLDALDYGRHGPVVAQAIDTLGGLDRVVIAYGTLPDQAACAQSAELAQREFELNATSIISLLTPLANHFEKRGKGTIAVISSVAGDRGRQSNYVYGAAKGALSLFLEGLRNRLAPKGVRVVTVKPGFVDTPMTAAFKKGALWATPDRVARDIQRALERGPEVLYTPWFWRWIMLIIRHIPEAIFKRMKL